MKVKENAGGPPAPARRDFKELFRKPKPEQPSDKVRARKPAEKLRTTGPTGVSQNVDHVGRVEAHPPARADALRVARAAMNRDVEQRRLSRTEGLASDQEKLDARLVDIICRELIIELGGDRPAAAQADFPGRRMEAAPPMQREGGPNVRGDEKAAHRMAPAVEAATAAAAAVALIEKIESFLKSQRPALALTLKDGLAERVEVERTGPGEVALKIRGRNGPPRPEDLSRIREEIRSRGLKLSALSVA